MFERELSFDRLTKNRNQTFQNTKFGENKLTMRFREYSFNNVIESIRIDKRLGSVNFSNINILNRSNHMI